MTEQCHCLGSLSARTARTPRLRRALTERCARTRRCPLLCRRVRRISKKTSAQNPRAPLQHNCETSALIIRRVAHLQPRLTSSFRRTHSRHVGTGAWRRSGSCCNALRVLVLRKRKAKRRARTNHGRIQIQFTRCAVQRERARVRARERPSTDGVAPPAAR